jgi:hypothetical protein
MEWFYELRYFPNYGCYYLYKSSEVIDNNGKQKVSEVINMDKEGIQKI